MHSKAKILWIAPALLLCGATCAADDEQPRDASRGVPTDPVTLARVTEFEKGPSSIDISKYPAIIQADYEVFHQHCTLCHKLSRPINSTYATPSEWSTYVKRMMFKPGSNITTATSKKVYTFLVYDSSIRKKDLLEKKLSVMSAEERAQEEGKIREILAAVEAK